ncbi:hypothetical protein AB0P05_45675 [Streptomyces flaveolus]|uniref:hypothetical protein n=1 Tax=Streptomyces flaveolus TaxID=67297 RepID=UPI0034398E2F
MLDDRLRGAAGDRRQRDAARSVRIVEPLTERLGRQSADQVAQLMIGAFDDEEHYFDRMWTLAFKASDLAAIDPDDTDSYEEPA